MHHGCARAGCETGQLTEERGNLPGEKKLSSNVESRETEEMGEGRPVPVQKQRTPALGEHSPMPRPQGQQSRTG